MSTSQGFATFGNWRRPVSAGLGQMGTTGTVVTFVGMMISVLQLSFATWVHGLIWGGCTIVAAAMFELRDKHHRTIGDWVVTRVAWLKQGWFGQRVYRGGVVSHLPDDACHLPGVGAATVLLPDMSDGLGQSFALLEMPYANEYALTFLASPEGDALIDMDRLDGWIGSYAQFLGRLPEDQSIVAATITIENVPDSGSLSQKIVRDAMHPQAPEIAKRIAQDIADQQGMSIQVRAYITLVFSAITVGGRKRTREEMIRDIGSALPGLMASMTAMGAGQPKPVSGLDLCEMVRSCYDPESTIIIERAKTEGQRTQLRWTDVGPMATQAYWDRYVHDSGLSVSWFMSGAPGGQVHGRILRPLLTPHPAIDRKRVTLMFRPLSPTDAATRVERAKNVLDFDITKTSRPSSRKMQERMKAEHTAIEESTGASILEFSIGMTVTMQVEDQDRLPDVVAAAEQLMGRSRLMMRRCYGSQDTAFLTTLPLGISLKKYIATPSFIKQLLPE